MTRLIYLIYASIHIILLTLTGSLLFSFVLSAVCVAILAYLHQRRYMVPIVAIPIISIALVWIYNIRHSDPSLGEYYVGTGIVSDYYRSDRYIIEVQDATYILRSEDSFHIGDEIFFQAYNSPAYTPNLQIYDAHWRDIMSGGYVFDYAKRQYMRGFAGTLYSTQSLVV